MIVDASALLPYLVDDAPSGRSVREAVGDLPIAAPALIDLELLSALRRHVAGGALSESRAAEAILDLQQLDLERMPHEPLLDRVWSLRANLTPYDAAYVALAERFDRPLLTCDKRLVNSTGPECEFLLLTV